MLRSDKLVWVAVVQSHPGIDRVDHLRTRQFFGTLVTCVAKRKVFSFADALGLLANLLCTRGDFSVARASAHEEVAGNGARQLHGAACTLCFNYRVSVVCRHSSGLARVGAWIHRLSTGLDRSRPEPHSGCVNCRRRDDCGSSMVESAPRREKFPSHRGALFKPSRNGFCRNPPWSYLLTSRSRL